MDEINEKIKTLQSYIDQSHSIVFLTGAGVSTDSGIPDFRGEGGIYKNVGEEMLSAWKFRTDPAGFFDFYRKNMLYLNAEPNITHEFIALCEKKHKSLGVITQNIDGLHQKAGSKRVYELHGNVHRNYCMECGKSYSAEYILHSDSVPRCSKDGCIIKPDVVLYGEYVNEYVYDMAKAAMQSSDMCIIMGTSLKVATASSMLKFFYGKRLVIVNKTETDFDSQADLVIHGGCGDVVSKLHV